MFGDKFVTGSRVLLILTAGYLATACTALLDSLMNMTGHHAANARITAAVLVLKLPPVCFAVACWGIAGAAFASAAATIIGRRWNWTYVRRTLDIDGTILGWFHR